MVENHRCPKLPSYCRVYLLVYFLECLRWMVGISWLQVCWTQKRRSLGWDLRSLFELASRTTRICFRLEKSQGFAECCVESHQATMTYLTRVVIKAYLWVHQGSALGQFKSERTSAWRSHQWGYQCWLQIFTWIHFLNTIIPSTQKWIQDFIFSLGIKPIFFVLHYMKVIPTIRCWYLYWQTHLDSDYCVLCSSFVLELQHFYFDWGEHCVVWPITY